MGETKRNPWNKSNGNTRRIQKGYLKSKIVCAAMENLYF